MNEHPIIDCPGTAHDNPHVDHCTTCAPRWGKVPAYVGMSAEAAWVLGVLARVGRLECPGMPDGVLGACRELEKHGYAEMLRQTVKGKGTVTSFLVYAATWLGTDAARKIRRGR